MVEQEFLPMGKVWSVHNADTQCTLWGERRPKGREKFLCLNFSCLAMKYECYFTKYTEHCTSRKLAQASLFSFVVVVVIEV